MFFEIFESLPGSLQNEFKKRKKKKKISFKNAHIKIDLLLLPRGHNIYFILLYNGSNNILALGRRGK
jgi:hypothetical protein